jgi:hypothetical protein
MYANSTAKISNRSIREVAEKSFCEEEEIKRNKGRYCTVIAALPDISSVLASWFLL